MLPLRQSSFGRCRTINSGGAASPRGASVHPEQQKAGDKPPSVHARVGHNYDARNVLNAHKRHKEDGPTLDRVAATTAERTGAHRPNPQDRRSSAKTSATRRSQHGSGNLPTSPSTPGKRTPSSGLMTTASLVSRRHGRRPLHHSQSPSVPGRLSESLAGTSLPARRIHNWADLVKVFVGNFQGTYVRLGNSWDLRSCRQKPDETP
jgi:hypothetical protein